MNIKAFASQFDLEESVMFEKNRLTAMLANKEVPLGMQCFTGDPVLRCAFGRFAGANFPGTGWSPES
jgi:hypothetical protein